VKRSVVDAALAMGHCDHVSPSELNALWERAYAAEARISELERRNANQAASLEVPRLQDVVRISELERNRDKQEATYRAACAQHDSHVKELEAEVGRLQGVLSEVNAHALSKMQKLAAANALLERCDDYSLALDERLKFDVRAHLANQPAAPENAEPRYVKPVSSTPRERDLEDKCERICEEYCKLSATWQDAVRLFNAWLVDSEGFCPVAQETRELLRGRPVLAQPAVPARTGAEQAVLDACAACTEADLRWVESGVRLGGRDTLIGIARAELALRGLK
jgi:hypothetical protein